MVGDWLVKVVNWGGGEEEDGGDGREWERERVEEEVEEVVDEEEEEDSLGTGRAMGGFSVNGKQCPL